MRSGGWTALQQALYLRQLSVMFKAGIPIHQAAAVLTRNQEYGPELRRLLGDVPRDLERGRLLSKALERSRLFDRAVVSSVRIGEESGRLDDVLNRLAENEERSLKLRRTLVSKLTYPLIVMLVMGLGLIVLGHVMSQVISSLPGFRLEDVPLFGPINAAFGHPGFLPACGLLLLGLLALLRKIWLTPRWRVPVEQQLLAVPVVGSLLSRFEATAVTSQMSLLLGAGTPLDRALELSAEGVATETFRQTLLRCREEIRAGCEISACFEAARIFPDDVLALVSAGELSGSLESSLERAAVYCSEAVERSLETALSLLEPLLIALLGAAIGAVILFTFVPVFNSLQTF